MCTISKHIHYTTGDLNKDCKSLSTILHFKVVEQEMIGKDTTIGERRYHLNDCIRYGAESQGVKILDIYSVKPTGKKES